MKQPPEKIRYKTRPIRMDDRTWETLKDKKIKSGLSWNLFLVEMNSLWKTYSKTLK